MNDVFHWFYEIIIIIISISFFQILVPESSMAKYLNFIFSLIILAVILEPVSKYI